jgi:hypothetical protein
VKRVEEGGLESRCGNHIDRREGKRMEALKGIFPEDQVIEISAIHSLPALEPFVGP